MCSLYDTEIIAINWWSTGTSTGTSHHSAVTTLAITMQDK